MIRSIFVFADEKEEVNVHFQYYNYPNLTLYVFQKKKKKKKIRHTLLSVFLSEEKKAAQYKFVSITWKTCIHSGKKKKNKL